MLFCTNRNRLFCSVWAKVIQSSVSARPLMDMAQAEFRWAGWVLWKGIKGVLCSRSENRLRHTYLGVSSSEISVTSQPHRQRHHCKPLLIAMHMTGLPVGLTQGWDSTALQSWRLGCCYGDIPCQLQDKPWALPVLDCPSPKAGTGSGRQVQPMRHMVDPSDLSQTDTHFHLKASHCHHHSFLQIQK